MKLLSRKAVALSAVFLFPLSISLRAAAEEDPFAANVRTTPHLSPDEERKAFKLPPGFEVDLFAAEPDINKPMNIAFDARGRIWVTSTVEYPYPVPLDKPARDAIKVLEDSDGDGRADKVTTFADGLNIPIGVLPYKDGCIAWSIPYIWLLRDTDGDGRADVREKLYGPFDHKHDTHGMNNAFRRGFDGWIYACHGYANDSQVKGADGHEVHMQSGNTYRFRPDGSRIEQFTWGQVNPFGMCFDFLDDIFTADCHSKPLYQLVRGGYYPSFGKPDDGLGFAPSMMEHLHGSTAIAGVAVYEGDNFPAAFRGNAFTGNVMTSRVNRDSLVRKGSTAIAKEEPDFISTTDPWFRPVDLQVGPDGALYIADFYNRIIGHYEVPLDHPGRDRTSGRIWRVSYAGKDPEVKPAKKAGDLSRASPAELIAALHHATLTERALATNELTDRAGKDAVPALKDAFRDAKSPRAAAHALWALHRLGAVDIGLLRAAASHASPEIRVHAMKALAETGEWTGEHRALVHDGLVDADPFVARAAADALGVHPRPENTRALMDLCRKAPAEDALLLHAARIALRNQLREPGALELVEKAGLDAAGERLVAGACLAIPGAEAGAFVTRHMKVFAGDRDATKRALGHAARYAAESEVAAIVGLARAQLGDDLDFQRDVFGAIDAAFVSRGQPLPKPAEEWGARLANDLLDLADSSALAWKSLPLDGKPAGENPWGLEPRSCSDGRKGVSFVSSLPHGEQLTGVLRSKAFALPPALRFFVAGHDGFPDKPAKGVNLVRLRDAKSGAVLRQAPAPRNDVAQMVQWDLAAEAGKEGVIELVDGDDGTAYAWIAAARFRPRVVAVPGAGPSSVSDRVRAASEIAARLRLEALKPRLLRHLADGSDAAASESAARALIAIDPDATLSALAPLIGDAAAPDDLRSKVRDAVEKREAAFTASTVKEAFRALPARQQLALAQGLAGDRAAAESLLSLAEAGHASARLLQNAAVKERLLAAKPDRAAERVAALTASLPSDIEAREKLTAARRKAYEKGTGSPERGLAVFTKTCATCHQIAGAGKVVGPQLDGIGNRGLERVLEDVLDPNRNVDVAFRATTFVLKDGKVISGLVRREEGEAIAIADSKGEEVLVPKASIATSERSELSLMPDNVGETVPEADFADLVAFLLSTRAAAK